MTKDNDNMKLWGEAYKTDPSHTKQYKGRGGFSGTAIASLYPVQRATELFGPMGYGWGFSIITNEFIEGGPIMTKVDKGDGSIELVDTGFREQTHSFIIDMWAKYNGHDLKTIGIGMTPHIYQTRYGIDTDHDVWKKSLTDALKGALKLWGFSADVFLGDHDDPEYVKHLANLVALDKAEDKVAEESKQAEEYSQWQETTIKLIKEAVNVNMLDGLYKAGVLKAKRRNDDDFIKKMIAECKLKKAELLAEKEAPDETV